MQNEKIEKQSKITKRRKKIEKIDKPTKITKNLETIQNIYKEFKEEKENISKMQKKIYNTQCECQKATIKLNESYNNLQLICRRMFAEIAEVEDLLTENKK